MILVDAGFLYTQNLYRVVYDILKTSETLHLPTYKETIFRSIAYDIDGLSKRFPDYADEIVIAIDSKPYWREDVFPDYKANRVRKPSPFTGCTKYELYNEMTEIVKAANLTVIQVDKCEADDIIFVLAKHCTNLKRKALIYSSDKDYVQTHSDYVQQYSDYHKQFITGKYNILEHILIGDAADNIPGVFQQHEFTDEAKTILESLNMQHITPDDMHCMSLPKELWNVNVYKPTRIGLAKIRKKLDGANGDVYKILTNESLLSRFNRNKALIDADSIPAIYGSKIIKAYNSRNTAPATSVIDALNTHSMDAMRQQLIKLFE